MDEYLKVCNEVEQALMECESDEERNDNIMINAEYFVTLLEIGFENGSQLIKFCYFEQLYCYMLIMKSNINKNKARLLNTLESKMVEQINRYCDNRDKELFV